MCSGSPPPAPDYEAAATATAEGNLEAARAATEANRYDQFTPLGDLTWTNLGYEQFDEEAYNAAMAAYQDQFSAYENQLAPSLSEGTAWDKMNDYSGFQSSSPSSLIAPIAPERADYTTMMDQDKWRSDITLSPEVQSLFDKGLMMQEISADIGLTAGEQIKDTFATPFELDDFEGYREDVYDAMLDRLETDIDKDWQSRNAELYAGGIGRGTEAYGWEQTMRDRSLNDARLQSYIGATDQALKERGQTVKEALLQRNQPLNEYNAWRTGSQVQLPSFQPTSPQQTVAGPDYLGAADAQSQYDLGGYSAGVSGDNALMGMLGDAASAYAMYAMFASDIRLKHNIKHIGETEKMGLPLYEFSYNGSDKRHIGVMAHEVREVIPEAVMTMANGYDAVNYGMIR